MTKLPFFKKKAQAETQPKKKNDTAGQADDLPITRLHKELADNLVELKTITGNSADIIVRELEIPLEKPVGAAVIMTEGLVNDQIVTETVIETLLQIGSQKIDQPKLLEAIEKQILAVTSTKRIDNWNSLFTSLLSGETIIFIDGFNQALASSTTGGDSRPVMEPQTEVTIRGPRESFNELLSTNTALIRRRIKNPHLWLEKLSLGKVNQTDIGIMYIKGIANDKIVEEVKRRLKKVDIDAIIESGSIEQLIEDETFSFFPTVYHSERPDVVAANLLEGRVAILINGSPFVLTVPALFIEFFQAADDYYMRFDISFAIRILRSLIFLISMIAPATYVAITTYHQEMIPTLLIIAIAAQREAVPFPAFFEAFIMEITFEILREAGVRLPRSIGQAVSIVGALVIGQAAVEAGIVSPAMVIVVSITAIASFATPSFSMAIAARLIRFILMLLAAIMGMYGIIVGLMIITLHLCSLRSFGIPYMAPLAPLMFRNIGDTFVRVPIWAMDIRPKLISQKNISRAGDGQKPSPPPWK